MNSKTKALLGLLVFNGVTAVGGGISLITEWIPQEPAWVEHTDFPSNYFPGVILMAIVGGSSLIAAVALMKRATGRQMAGIVAGVIMVFWIVGQVVSIREFHFLQVVYLATGALVVFLTPGTSEQPRSVA